MYKTISFKKKLLAASIASCTLAGFSATAFAQSADAVEEVVVTGIKASLQKSMDLKRDAEGVVDAISAEDIGKFPDTNLAESLQRITGVSIDRQGGEGSKITVRGIGAEHNLVTLNGRMMARTTGDRSFDFSNIASEMVSTVSVFKTSNATMASGGMGSSVDIGTARPLNNPGQKAVINVKGMADGSSRDSSLTPELFGLYSNTFADDTIGISISTAYQKRNSGSSEAEVGTGWRTFTGNQDQDWSGSNATWGGVPKTGQVNRVTSSSDLYSVPQTTIYRFTESKRERTNGQLVLQWKPVDNLKATLDVDAYTRTVETRKNDVSAWFTFAPSHNVWTNGPVSSPLIYSEQYGSPQDLSMAAGLDSTKFTGNSVGLNVEWQATDKLKTVFDLASSHAKSTPNSPYGSALNLSSAAFIRTSATTDFTGDIPALIVGHGNSVKPTDMQVTGSVFGSTDNKSDITQSKLAGNYSFDDSTNIDFGVQFINVKNRHQDVNVQNNDWGGLGKAGDLASVYAGTEDTVVDHFNGSFGNFSEASKLTAAGLIKAGNTLDDGTVLSSANVQNKIFMTNFEQLRAAAEKAYNTPSRIAAAPVVGNCGNGPSIYCGSKDYQKGNDVTVEEKSKAFYLQQNFKSTIAEMPFNAHLGMRYEATDVTSTSASGTYNGAIWIADTEIELQVGKQSYLTKGAKYNYFLPNIDLSLDVTDDVKVRASTSKTIGRAGYDDLKSSLNVGQLANRSGGGGSTGNVELKPLESTNLDLSVEWYFSENSYASAGYFKKSISNYVDNAIVEQSLWDIHNPADGPYYNQALAATGSSDAGTIRKWIANNLKGSPGVDTTTYTDPNKVRITAQPTDKLMNFKINTKVNGKTQHWVEGYELAVQYVFGESGFGGSANATLAKTDLEYNNASQKDQSPLNGMSDTYNIVGFYEKYGVSVRLAYNWRDQFIFTNGQGTGANPQYTEPYGQFDLNASYEVMDGMQVFLQGINITDAANRTHGRDERQVLFYGETGPRWIVGASYAF